MGAITGIVSSKITAVAPFSRYKVSPVMAEGEVEGKRFLSCYLLTGSVVFLCIIASVVSYGNDTLVTQNKSKHCH